MQEAVQDKIIQHLQANGGEAEYPALLALMDFKERTYITKALNRLTDAGTISRVIRYDAETHTNAHIITYTGE